MSWKIWLDPHDHRPDFTPGNYEIGPEALLRGVYRRIKALSIDPKLMERIDMADLPTLFDLTRSVIEVGQMANALGDICQELGVGPVDTVMSGSSSPIVAVKFLNGRKWLVIKFDHQHVTSWIFGRCNGEGAYEYFPVDPPYSVSANGDIVLEYEGKKFEFPGLGLDAFAMLLDRGRAIAIGLIREALEGDDTRPLRSLKRCPHPYKRYGFELEEFLERLDSILRGEW